MRGCRSTDERLLRHLRALKRLIVLRMAQPLSAGASYSPQHPANRFRIFKPYRDRDRTESTDYAMQPFNVLQALTRTRPRSDRS